MNPRDRQRGWNWTYWADVRRPLLEELNSPPHVAALTAPLAATQVKANAADVAVSTREAGGGIYVIAVRKSAKGHGSVRFSGLPTSVGRGSVLVHPGGNPARPVAASRGTFTDPSPFGGHNARVYQFRAS
jgi:hypothetical protein